MSDKPEKEKYPLHQIIYDLLSWIIRRPDAAIAEVKALQDAEEVVQSRGISNPTVIRFSLTDIPNMYECGRCGGGVVNIDVHRSWHMTGR